MDTVFISFANSSTDKLPSLTEEDEKVNTVLSRRKMQGAIDLVREQYASSHRMLETLFLYQNKLSVFLYSGHAGRDRLLLEDQDANAEGIAALLQQCPNIKLVVLNGCSTKGQVQQLLDLGIPIVIATSAPVEDPAATQFSIAFFTSLAERMNSVQKAFQDGLAAAKMVSKQKIALSHSSLGRGTKIEELPWGIFYQPENEIYLDWRLGEAEIIDEVFEPNKLLLDSIWEAIKPYLGASAEELDTFKFNDKIDKIITELPHPLSDYLRKLIASKRQGEKDEFYNELGVNRLKYLLYTYTNCIEILCFTMLSQLWDEMGKGNLTKIHAGLQQELEKLFACNFRDRRTYSLLAIIREMRICFEENNIDHFFEEFVQVSESFRQLKPLYHSSVFMESIREEIENDPNVNEQKAKKLCIDLEKHLATILGELGFLAKYKMASMKSIDFIKYKHDKFPRFRHNFVELRYRPSGMNIESETLEDSMDNASVIFIHEQGDAFKYLNLSPFIVDVNSFDEKAQLADLCLFLSYEPSLKAFTYRYIYKPAAFPLRVDGAKPYAPIILEQFNAFYQLIFNKSVQL